MLEGVHNERENVRLFYNLLPDLVNGISTDDFYEEFPDYQILRDDGITDEGRRETKVSDRLKKDVGDEDNSYHYRVDILLWHISKLVIPRTLAKRFKLLPS